MLKKISLLILLCIAAAVFICADRRLNSDIYGENINIRLYVEKGGYQYDDNRETAENSYEILYSKTSGVTVPSILKIKGRLSDACYYDEEYRDNFRLKLSKTELYLLHKYILKKQNPDNEYYFPNYNKKEYYRINYYLNSAKKLQNISADSKNFDDPDDIKNLYDIISFIYFAHKYIPYFISAAVVVVLLRKYNIYSNIYGFLKRHLPYFILKNF